MPDDEQPGENPEVVARVKRERKRRGLSLTTAARMGSVGPSTWSTFERTGHLTPGMVKAITRAFSWPIGWFESDDQPTQVVTQPSNGDLAARVVKLETRVDELLDLLLALGAIDERRRGALRVLPDPKPRTKPRPSAPGRSR